MRKRKSVLLLCAAAALCLTACQNSGGRNQEQKTGQETQEQPVDDSDASGEGQEDAGNEQPGGQTAKITFVLDWTPNTNHTGVYVAQAKGYFEEAGLDVDVIQPPEDGATLLVAGGGAQFGVDFQDSLAPAFAGSNPLPVTAVAGIIQHNTSGLVSLKEQGIDTPKKMEGHTYATWNLDTEQAILKYVMEQDGGDFSKLDMIPSTVTDVVTALGTDVDLVWIYYAWDGVATQVKGIETNYISFADLDESLDYYSPVIIANNEYLEQNPEQAKAFLSAVKKGYEFAIEHPEEASQILCDAVPELDQELVLESQKWLADQYQADAASWGVIDGKRWDGFYQWLFDNGVIDQEIPQGTGYSNAYLE